MPKAMRADLHERMATRLEQQAVDGALIGYHLEQAFSLRRQLGRPNPDLALRAGGLLRAAAQEAFGRSDVAATISLYERARPLLADDRESLPALLTDLGYAQIEAGAFPTAETTFAEACEAATQQSDRVGELHALVGLQFARSYIVSGVATDATIAVARAAIEELEAVGDDLGVARAWWLKGDTDGFAGRWRESTKALENAFRSARRASVSRDVVSGLTGLLPRALVFGPTPVPDAIARLDELLLEVGDDRALAAGIRTSYALLLAMQGSFDEARRMHAESGATYNELGLRLRRIVDAVPGAHVALLAGDAAAAERELRAAIDVIGPWPFGAILADILCTVGRVEEAEALAHEIAEVAPADDLLCKVLWRTTLARLYAERGDVAEATKLVEAARGFTASIEYPDLRVAALCTAAQVVPAEAQTLLGEARGIARAKGNVVALARLDAALAGEATPAIILGLGATRPPAARRASRARSDAPAKARRAALGG
jgi:hypothetical protein